MGFVLIRNVYFGRVVVLGEIISGVILWCIKPTVTAGNKQKVLFLLLSRLYRTVCEHKPNNWKIKMFNTRNSSEHVMLLIVWIIYSERFGRSLSGYCYESNYTYFSNSMFYLVVVVILFWLTSACSLLVEMILISLQLFRKKFIFNNRAITLVDFIEIMHNIIVNVEYCKLVIMCNIFIWSASIQFRVYVSFLDFQFEST